MRGFIPFGYESHQPLGQFLLAGEIHDPQSLPPGDAEPLLHLVHPRTMDRRMRKDKPRVLGQPGLHLLALVHPQVVQNDPDRLDRRGDLLVEILQKRDEFCLSLPASSLAVDLAATRIKGREQIQCSAPAVFVFDAGRLILLGCQGRRLSRPRLQAGHLVDTQNHLVGRQRPRVQVADLLNLGCEGSVTRHLGRQPHLLPPRLQAVVPQDLTHGLRRDLGHHAVTHQLPSNLSAIPLGQRAPKLIRPFAGDLHHVHRDLGGKRPAYGRVRGDRLALRGDFSGTVWSTCAHASPSCRPTGRLPPEPTHRPRPESHALVEPNPKGSSCNEDVVPVRSVPPGSAPRATKSFGLASEPPCSWNQVLNEAGIMTENPNSGNSNPYLLGAVLRSHPVTSSRFLDTLGSSPTTHGGWTHAPQGCLSVPVSPLPWLGASPRAGNSDTPHGSPPDSHATRRDLWLAWACVSRRLPDFG